MSFALSWDPMSGLAPMLDRDFEDEDVDDDGGGPEGAVVDVAEDGTAEYAEAGDKASRLVGGWSIRRCSSWLILSG